MASDRRSKNNCVSVRYDNSTYLEIEDISDRCNLTKSEVVRVLQEIGIFALKTYYPTDFTNTEKLRDRLSILMGTVIFKNPHLATPRRMFIEEAIEKVKGGLN